MDEQEQKKLMQKLSKSNHSLDELVEFVNSIDKKPLDDGEHRIGKSVSKMTVMGDNHLGHKATKKKFTKYAIDHANSESDMLLNTGDIFDGWYQNRPSSIFEQYAIGFDQQMKDAVNTFKNIKVPFYFITGNHSYNTFVRGAGVEAGPILQDRLRQEGVNAHYIGNAEGNLRLKNGTKVKLLHPDGGTAYAISYKPQKIIESFGGGEKPDILLIGHFHKADYIFYRNVHAFQTGTMCGQTKFMRGKGIPAHVGFWDINVQGHNPGNVDALNMTFYPKYD